MGKENVVTLQKKFDVVLNLLTLVGAEKLSIDDRAFFISLARDGKNKELCNSIAIACDKVIEHLDVIKTFIK